MKKYGMGTIGLLALAAGLGGVMLGERVGHTETVLATTSQAATQKVKLESTLTRVFSPAQRPELVGINGENYRAELFRAMVEFDEISREDPKSFVRDVISWCGGNPHQLPLSSNFFELVGISKTTLVEVLVPMMKGAEWKTKRAIGEVLDGVEAGQRPFDLYMWYLREMKAGKKEVPTELVARMFEKSPRDATASLIVVYSKDKTERVEMERLAHALREYLWVKVWDAKELPAAKEKALAALKVMMASKEAWVRACGIGAYGDCAELFDEEMRDRRDEVEWVNEVWSVTRRQ